MPNPIKYSTSAQTLALKKGNFWIGTGDVGKGPTSTTDYYNGITPPSGGYTIYLNKASGGPSIYTASNSSQLISLTNSIAGASYTTTAQCLTYFATQTDKMVFNIDYPAIITNGLVLNLDAGFTPSYPTIGTTWYDVSSGGSNGSLINGPTYSSANSGCIVFDGVDDYVSCSNNTNITGSNPSTMEITCKFTSLPLTFVNPMMQIGDGTGHGNFRLLYLRYVDNEYPQPKLAVAWYDSGFTYDFTPTQNQIYVFTYTDNGSNESKLYINGSLVTTYTSYTALETNTNALYVGKFTYTSNGISGNVYNSKIYNRVLTAAEVLQNFNATKSRYGL